MDPFNPDNDTAKILEPKKPPRKPRPSEIAAKKAKAAKKKATKPAGKRPKAKKVVKGRSRQKNKAFPAKPKARKAKKPAPSGVQRPGRLDLRLTKSEKARIVAKAKKARRTITSIVLEAIEKIR